MSNQPASSDDGIKKPMQLEDTPDSKTPVAKTEEQPQEKEPDYKALYFAQLKHSQECQQEKIETAFSEATWQSFRRALSRETWEGVYVLRFQEIIIEYAKDFGVQHAPNLCGRVCDALDKNVVAKAFGPRFYTMLKKGRSLLDLVEITESEHKNLEQYGKFIIHSQLFWLEAQSDPELCSSTELWKQFLTDNEKFLKSHTHPSMLGNFTAKYWAQTILSQLIPIRRWYQLINILAMQQGKPRSNITYPPPRAQIDMLYSLPELSFDKHWSSGFSPSALKCITLVSKRLHYVNKRKLEGGKPDTKRRKNNNQGRNGRGKSRDNSQRNNNNKSKTNSQLNNNGVKGMAITSRSFLLFGCVRYMMALLYQ